MPRIPLNPFSSKLFERTQLFSHYCNDVDGLIRNFQSYEQVVPICGAPMLNHAFYKVVLVSRSGRDARWSFPKGKLAKKETELNCAAREFSEETGFDITSAIEENSHAIGSLVCDRYGRLFFIHGVPENTQFATKTKKEISNIQWVPISILSLIHI